jgi:hypothetical protein
MSDEEAEAALIRNAARKLEYQNRYRDEKSRVESEAELRERQEDGFGPLGGFTEKGIKKERRGYGGVKGSKVIYSYHSVRKLQELGFDPLEKLTELYEEISETLAAKNERGERLVKLGSLAHATMLGHLKGISDSLSKYSYRAIPEKKEVDFGAKVPTMITLTTNKKFDEAKVSKEENDQ